MAVLSDVQPGGQGRRFRFRDFELDVAAYELRRQGRPVKLGRQAMELLILLVESRPQLVPRSAIVDRLWGKDVFVDVETGVNTNISKVRQALRDSPDAPAFVETVPGMGYRFVAPVEVVSEAPEPSGPAIPLVTPPAAPASQAGKKVSRARLLSGMLALACAAGIFLGWRWLGSHAPVARVSLAVLPFENLGTDPQRQYLADGLTDETAASLAQVDPGRLSVKGRTLRYKGTTKSVAEIGQELSVDYLVESSIRSEGARVRVTTTLIRVRDQEHVWSQSYEREPTSLLGLQQELSTAITEQVRMRLSPDRATGLERRQTRSAEAYDEYLRARFLTNRRTPVTNAQAVEHYKRAIAIDADYALAWSDLALTYTASIVNGDAPPLAVWPLARKAAAEAIRANPDLAEAHAASGYVNWLLEWNWTAAEAEFRKAAALDPGSARIQLQLGHLLSQMGRKAEAESATRRARELEPFDALNYALSSQVSFQGHDYSAAVEHARKAILLDSNLWIGYVELGQAYAQLGSNELALEALADAARFSGGNSKPVSFHGYVLAKAGRGNEAREVIRTLEASSAGSYVPPFAVALVHAGLGERDAVFEWLDKAYDAHDVHLMFLTVDPKWDPYRADPRFDALLERCGFPRVAIPARAGG